jgi:hypothetical protein
VVLWVFGHDVEKWKVTLLLRRQKSVPRQQGLSLSIETRNGRGKRHKRTHRITIGTIHFSIPPGAAAIKIKLNAAGRARLRASRGRLNAMLIIQQAVALNLNEMTTETIRLIEYPSGAAKAISRAL